MNRYWTEVEHKDLEQVASFAHLADIALRVVARILPPVGQVCGPITTGGHGDIEKNMNVFVATINRLEEQGLNIFNQVPFQQLMRRLKATHPNGEIAILEQFYGPLFRSGFITTLYFIPGWETSFGAKWEHGQAQHLGLEVVYL